MIEIEKVNYYHLKLDPYSMSILWCILEEESHRKHCTITRKNLFNAFEDVRPEEGF